jgi:FtsH-binding integral membrane protein
LFTRHSKFSRETLSPITYYATTAATGAALGLVFASNNLSYADLRELKGIFLTAFIYTGAIFISMTVFAFLTVRRMQIYLGCAITALVLSIISIFIINTNLYAFIGILVGILYLIVDTQLMINKAENGMIEPFEDARQIYYDLLKIFVRIVVLLLKDKKEKKDN